MLLRDASNSMDLLRQRYADSKHSSATTMSSTPLTDLDLSNHESGYNGTPTAGMTTFLPTLHSTPPMPTFQKPGMRPRSSPLSTPTSNITRRPATHHDDINDLAIDPPHFDSTMSTSTSANTDGEATGSQPPLFARRRVNIDSGNPRPKRIYIPHRNPETVDGYQLATASGESPSRVIYSRGARAYTTTPLIDRVPDTPPLPEAWNPTLDRLICKVDAAGYDHARIVKKVRQLNPQLGGVLTPTMIDKRLRQLDMDIEIDYWRTGLRSKDESEARVEERTQDLPDQRSTREAVRTTVTREEQEQQDHFDALQQRQGEERHQIWSLQYGAATRDRDEVGSSSMGVRRSDD